MALSTSNSGDLFVATTQDAWSCNIDKKSCTKLCSAPEGVEFNDMAYNPKDGGPLFCTRTGVEPRGESDDPNKGAVYLERGTSKPLPVLLRRLDYLQGIAFSSDGQLFFGTRGDLWHGIIEQNE